MSLSILRKWRWLLPSFLTPQYQVRVTPQSVSGLFYNSFSLRSGHYSDLENYFSSVCPQVVQLIDCQDDSNSKLIGAACLRTLLERSLVLSRRYLLNPLMEPLLRLTEETFANQKVPMACFSFICVYDKHYKKIIDFSFIVRRGYRFRFRPGKVRQKATLFICHC